MAGGHQVVVKLIACDTHGACSAPAAATIDIQQVAPPVGGILSPRAGANTCIAAGSFDVTFQVSDPAARLVTATLYPSDPSGNPPPVALGSVQVQTLPNNAIVQGTIANVNSALIPEGRRQLFLKFDNGAGGIQIVNTGGNITFDRTVRSSRSARSSATWSAITPAPSRCRPYRGRRDRAAPRGRLGHHGRRLPADPDRHRDRCLRQRGDGARIYRSADPVPGDDHRRE